MKETLKPIKGYTGLYSITRSGKVWSHRTNIWIKLWHNEAGYQRAPLRRRGVVRLRYVHRLVAFTFIPNPLSRRCVNHLDFDRANNRDDNLEWCTHRQNMA